MPTSVQVLADSVSSVGDHRLTTLMCSFPRFILAEVNTTRMFARNSASSRAIPVEKKILSVLNDMFVPAAFGKNQKGMQHAEVLDGDEAARADAAWRRAGSNAVLVAEELAGLGVHKQYANRVLEPFAYHTAIITATDWANHEHQRVNPAAQGEYQELAAMMKDAIDGSTPEICREGQWHLPLVRTHRDLLSTTDRPFDEEDLRREGFDPVKISVARCARVSFLTHEGKRDPAKDIQLYDETLAAKGHMSPLEHAARPMTAEELALTCTYDVSFENGPTLRLQGFRPTGPDDDASYSPGESLHGKKIVRVRGPLHYAGNLNGWISQRMMIHGEEDILGYRQVL